MRLHALEALSERLIDSGHYARAIDTGMVLQLRQALDLISIELAELSDALAMLALRHRATPVMGRTWMQHALPVTFGLKVAGWLDALLREFPLDYVAQDWPEATDCLRKMQFMTRLLAEIREQRERLEDELDDF